jgi:hypothetical protein
VNEPSDPNAPLRGPTFAVVAPTVGVVIVLALLALRSCGLAGPPDPQAPKSGALELSAPFERVGCARLDGGAVS